jgi:hypothetical protein
VNQPKKQPDPPPTLSPAMAEILEDALAIQDRFEAAPLLKTTGQGSLKSRGVEGLRKDAEELRKKLGRAARREN